MVSILIAESALEQIPNEIKHYPKFQRFINNNQFDENQLLDRSIHHFFMVGVGLLEHWKRGRPDIVHFSLLSSLFTPLYYENKLDVYLHTYDKRIITFGKGIRLPKSYNRFEGLMKKLFKEKVILDDNGNTLLKVKDNVSVDDFIRSLKLKKIIGLSSLGNSKPIASLVDNTLSNNQDACMFVVGGFPKGHFSEKTRRLFDNVYSISKFSLESHVVISRLVYECEKFLMKEGIDNERNK